MTLRYKKSAVALAAMAGLAALPAHASTEPVKIGFITDLSGLYSDSDGKGGLEAIRMAVADFGGKVLGRPVQVLDADHQNKADIAAARAREWFDRDHVDLLIGGTNSGAALAMNKVAAEKKHVYINVGAGSELLTNQQCTPYTIHYAYDTVAQARSTAATVTHQGGKSWYFLTADYTFGHSLEEQSAKVVKASGGQVLGQVKHPLSASDFSSFLVQAKASKAQVLGLANAGGDTMNAIKSAHEFGIDKNMKVVGLLVFLTDVHSLGLPTTQGMQISTTWYWDMNKETRAFAKRYYAKMHKMPTSLQAADYSAALTYLKAVQAAGTTDSDKVMAKLKSSKVNDVYTKNTPIRADGQLMHPYYLAQVKTPSESKGPWDLYKILAAIPAEQAFTTPAQSACYLMKKK